MKDLSTWLTYLGLSAILAFLFLSTGCTSFSNNMLATIDALNKRQIRGCYDNELVFAGGGGIGAGVSGSASLRGVIVTGGMDLEQCAAYKKSMQ